MGRGVVGVGVVFFFGGGGRIREVRSKHGGRPASSKR